MRGEEKFLFVCHIRDEKAGGEKYNTTRVGDLKKYYLSLKLLHNMYPIMVCVVNNQLRNLKRYQ